MKSNANDQPSGTMSSDGATPGNGASQKLILSLLIASAGLGVLLRAMQYFNRTGFWLDEAMLAVNIIERSPRALIFSPLEYNLLAPPGFLQLSKLSTMIFGPTDLALRLIPFLASVAALVLFVVLARKTLSAAESVFGVLLFSLASPLLVYAAEAKPYAVDVFAAILIFLVAFKVREQKYSVRSIVIAALAALASVTISTTAMIVIFGTGIGLVLLAWLERDSRALKAVAILAPIGLIGVGASAAGAIRQMVGGSMHSLWNSGFMPFPWRSLSDATWLWTKLMDIYSIVVGVNGAYGLVVILGLVGAISLWKRGRRDVVLVVLSPIAAGIVLAMAHTYPLAPGRITLYLAAPFILALAAGVGATARRLQAGAPFVFSGLFLVFLSVPEFVKKGETPPGRREDIRPILSHIRSHYRAGDRIYVYWGATPAMRIYAPRYGLDTAQWTAGVLGRENDWRSFVPQLDKFKGSPRVWVIMSHILAAEPREGIVHYLDSVGRRIDDPYPVPTKETDATLTLYDLSR